MSEVDNLLSKKVADRYLKREVLGEGTYGVVYKAIIDTKVAPFRLEYWIMFQPRINDIFSKFKRSKTDSSTSQSIHVDEASQNQSNETPI